MVSCQMQFRRLSDTYMTEGVAGSKAVSMGLPNPPAAWKSDPLPRRSWLPLTALRGFRIHTGGVRYFVTCPAIVRISPEKENTYDACQQPSTSMSLRGLHACVGKCPNICRSLTRTMLHVRHEIEHMCMCSSTRTQPHHQASASRHVQIAQQTPADRCCRLCL